MNKNNKIYLSCSKLDLQNEDNKQNLQRFIKSLEIFSSKFIDKDIKIESSLDENISKLNQFTDFIIILSDNYLIDKEVVDELNEIKTLSSSNEEIRIFKILCNKIDTSQQPDFLQALLNYNFYFFENEENTIIDFYALHGFNKAIFSNKIVDLGYDINTLASRKDKEQKEDTHPSKTIYLAYTGIDQINNRERLKRELQQKGLTVLPTYNFTGDKDNLRKLILDDLSKVSLSIHILGEDNFEISSEKTNLVELQNKISIEHYNKLNEFSSKKRDLLFSRIIWLPSGLNIKSEAQKIWLTNFMNSVETQIGGELIETPIELLKTIIEEKIENKIKPVNQNNLASSTSEKRIYILYEYNNSNLVESISKTLSNNKIIPLVTNFDNNYLSIIEKHRYNLISSDSIIIIHLNKNDDWLESKIMDIKKSPGFGRSDSFNNKIIITNNKLKEETYTSEDYSIIELEKDTDKTLNKLMQMLKE